MSIRTTGLFIPQWYVGKGIEKEIEKMFIGRTLCFPCGISKIGDVRVDLCEDVKPDVVADLLDFHGKFDKLGFDTVFCDPPFSFYTDNNIGWKWIYNVTTLARQRVIFKTPKIKVPLKRSLWKKFYVIIEDSGGRSFQFLQVFDRIVKPLEMSNEE